MEQGTTSDWFSDESATFGDRLAAAREAARLTQEDFARRLGVRLPTVVGWEDDVAEPRANKLQMMAGMLNVSIMWLLTGNGDGVDPPSEGGTDNPGPALDLLAELRQLRAEMGAMGDRLGRLEKRLRAVMKDAI